MSESEEFPSSQTLVIRLQQLLDTSSKAVEEGDYRQSVDAISEIVEFLSSISDAAISDPTNQANLNNSIALLSHIQSFLSNPSLDQAIVDALSFELPKAIAKFAGVSQRCYEIVETIMDRFTVICSPRDMISVFSEALDSYGKTTDAPGYVSVLLRGVSKVLLSIQRRQVEQIKVALPIILNAMKVAAFDLDDSDVGVKDLFEGASSIANSMLETCKKRVEQMDSSVVYLDYMFCKSYLLFRLAQGMKFHLVSILCNTYQVSFHIVAYHMLIF